MWLIASYIKFGGNKLSSCNMENKKFQNFVHGMPYVANCLRWKSFVVAECNSLENIHG